MVWPVVKNICELKSQNDQFFLDKDDFIWFFSYNIVWT